jgi:hypothetical protein
MKNLRDWFAPVVHLSSNWISLTGVVLLTTGGLLWLLLMPSMLRGEAANAYLGILMFVILPAIFFTGLALVPAGILWQKKRAGLPASLPPLDLKNIRFRRLLVFLGVTTAANLVIGSQLTYRAVHYMETVSFCGQTCHTVMKPEFAAYQNSPHSRVACVSCHIGPGANWFVKSKLSGAWQVVSVNLNLYQRPIPTPVHDLRPARETCEVCHWPQKFGGNRIRVIDTFSEDEKAAASKTVLLMRIGGGATYDGIHGAHMGPGVVIRYAHSDEQRQKIPWVEYKRGEAPARHYRGAGHQADGPGGLAVRIMDCMDCHNRPSHTFELPGRSLDHALSEGRLSAALPFVKKAALEALKAEARTTAEAERQVPERFRAFYRGGYPELWKSQQAAIEQGAQAVLAIYSRNVFPEMNVKWGSYPNNIGHTDFTGCFRCHDERSETGGKRTLTQDCNTCHSLLAMDEKDPKVLSDLGLAKAPEGGN